MMVCLGAFPHTEGGGWRPAVNLCCLFKNALRSTTGSADPPALNLLSGKYQVTWPKKSLISKTSSALSPFQSDPSD